MQEARPGTVLGRFDSVRFTDNGLTTTFARRGDRYVVNTEGGEGRLQDVEIRYTFGVFPLQQYLVATTRGRLQALTIAWDARPATVGGQRWFSLTPGEMVDHTSELHWTGRAFNWNYMCADCHSTAVRKGYSAATDTFVTTSSELSVGCEACHGPASSHVTWSERPRWLRRRTAGDNRLEARLTERHGVAWRQSLGARTATRSAPRSTDREIEVCAQCHASRAHIADGYTAGARMLDYYIPSLLLAGDYYPDGQQRDEVYDYGSFVQSRMYAAGVTCADCHEPHTQRLRKPGNAVCTQCHSTTSYDTTAHHFHPQASAAARCVACHMPDTAYMQIDPRHDHSLRVPRPDLTVRLGVPNVCSGCHADRPAQWAVDQIRARLDASGRGFQRFAEAFATDDADAVGAADSLVRVARDSTEPAMVRASALARLASRPGQRSYDAARAGAGDSHPLVRLAALEALEAYPPRSRIVSAVPLLGDTTRAVRQGAAWTLASIGDSLGTPLQRRAFAAAAEEFIASQRYNADQPSNRFALGAFYARRGQLDSAAVELRAALRLSPHDRRTIDALVAVLRAEGRIEEATRLLD
jgi:predicted CXXCH cytochrome family protein